MHCSRLLGVQQVIDLLEGRRQSGHSCRRVEVIQQCSVHLVQQRRRHTGPFCSRLHGGLALRAGLQGLVGVQQGLVEVIHSV
jgi:hypothetical protein